MYLVKQQAVVHLVFGMAQDRLTLELELDDADRFERRVHRLEVGINRLRKQCQLAKAHAVAVFERPQTAVLDAVAHDVGDAGFTACRRAHPENIVVAPFDIERMRRTRGEQFHDLVRRITAVEDISDDVQPVDRKAFEQLRERDQKVLRADFDDRVEDDLVIVHLIVVLVLLRVQQLVENIGVVLGHRLAHLGTRVFGGQCASQLDHHVERARVPFAAGYVFVTQQAELLFRIVNQRAQLLALLVGERAAVEPVHLLADDARAVVENVIKRLILAVQVAHKVLGALGQVENGGEIDDLAR